MFRWIFVLGLAGAAGLIVAGIINHDWTTTGIGAGFIIGALAAMFAFAEVS